MSKKPNRVLLETLENLLSKEDFNDVCGKIQKVVQDAIHKEMIEMAKKVKDRDRKMYRYYRSVFKYDFEGGYPEQWDDFLEIKE